MQTLLCAAAVITVWTLLQLGQKTDHVKKIAIGCLWSHTHTTVQTGKLFSSISVQVFEENILWI